MPCAALRGRICISGRDMILRVVRWTNKRPPDCADRGDQNESKHGRLPRGDERGGREARRDEGRGLCWAWGREHAGIY